MLLLHLSDLHLSRYGERGDWSQPDEEEGWELVHQWQRWRIEGRRDRKGRPDKLRLLDPEGVVHQGRGWPARKDEKIISRLLALAMERHLTSAEALVTNRPTPEDLQALLRLDPTNTNLRFLQVVDQLLPLGPELIAVTGDTTDNGFGYRLLEHYLQPWIDRQRLFVVPGNHDTYEIMPRRGRRARIQAKGEQYRAFSQRIGNAPNAAGAYVRRIGDIAIVGLNSCNPLVGPLSASGEVAREQLVWLHELGRDPAFQQERLRLCLVHHHLLRMPFELGRRAPIEVGMRLRNAPEVMQTCSDAGIDIMLNGHRHHGYMVQLPGHPMVVSSPSSTLGCKSSDRRYVWLLDLAERHPYPVMHVFSDDPTLNDDDQSEAPSPTAPAATPDTPESPD
ncbi:MAG: metallophosphoesterase [Proteobacteria bacterium]|nr:metallophosphoesterase [Pseudomonadota bacterium]